MKFLVLWLFTFCLAATPASPSESPSASETWKSAKDLYAQGNYEAALKAFQSAPEDNAAYYFDLGTTFLKIGRMGSAVAYLEKANHLETHDTAIQQNLRIAKAALSQTLGPEGIDPASTSIETLVDRISIVEIRGAIGIFGFFLVLVWFRTYLKSKSLRKTLVSPAGILGLLSLLLTVGLYGAERIAESHPPAIVLERTTVRSGPGDRYLELGRLEAGTKIRLLGPEQNAEDTHAAWKQIRFTPDAVGWAPANTLLDLE
jgi:tetratricopeptide (TPR) repeat protein